MKQITLAVLLLLAAILVAAVGVADASALSFGAPPSNHHQLSSKHRLLARLRNAAHGNNGEASAMQRTGLLQRELVHRRDHNGAIAALRRKALHGGKADDEPMACDSCKAYMVILTEVVKNETRLEEAEAAAVAECTIRYGPTNATKEAECIATVRYVVSVLPAGFSEMEFLAWNIPFNLCAILFDNICTQDCCTSNYAPEQVYISLADSNDFSQMRVTWVTLKEGKNRNVAFSGPNGVTKIGTAEPPRTYTYAGWIGTVNTAVMTGLTPDTTYSYTVGSDEGRSSTFSFRTFPTNIGTLQRPLRMLNLADMSYTSSSDNTIAKAGAMAKSGAVDLLIFNGDISYADGYMAHWDIFLRKISPAFAPYVPMITNPGNHEYHFNFTAYKTRLGYSMPRDADTLGDAMYYAVNIGPVRILMMNTESDINTPDIPDAEVAWAQQQLSSQDRKAQPWAVVFHHRPLYCNYHPHQDCDANAYTLRLQIESTYLNNKVDFIGEGHVHAYLRSYPLSMGRASGTSYDNPAAPVYVVNGAAGNREGNKKRATTDDMFPSASLDVGYGIMSISAATAAGNGNNSRHTLTYTFY